MLKDHSKFPNALRVVLYKPLSLSFQELGGKCLLAFESFHVWLYFFELTVLYVVLELSLIFVEFPSNCDYLLNMVPVFKDFKVFVDCLIPRTCNTN